MYEVLSPKNECMESSVVAQSASHVPYQRHRPSPIQLNANSNFTFLHLHLLTYKTHPKCRKQKPGQQKLSQMQADGKASADSGKSAPARSARARADCMRCDEKQMLISGCWLWWWVDGTAKHAKNNVPTKTDSNAMFKANHTFGP